MTSTLTLLDALYSAGLVVNDLITDGTLQRCGTIKKPRGKNGWYIVYDNGAACIYGNWELGDGYEFWSDGTKVKSDYHEPIEKLKKQREEEHDKGAQEALEYIENCKNSGFSDYLKNKRIYPHGVKFDTNCIVIPMQDASGKIWSYQRIYNDGTKYFMQGGRVKGCYYLIASRNINKDEKVIVCEGFATGASIAQATGLPVVVAFNGGNLKRVCDSLVFRNITIAADNDASGVGEKYAKESGYPYVMPSQEGKDFSDLFLENADIGKYFFTEEAKKGDIVAHGLVGMIADWITSTSVRPQPMLSIGAALTFVGMVKGHKYATPTDLRSNLLTLCIAPSSSGKEHPQNCLIRLMSATGNDKHLLAEPVSGAGFLTGLLAADCKGLLVLDEIGRYLANAMGKNANGFQREIIDYIIKSFSKANSKLIGRQYANNKMNPRVDVENPLFCCYGLSVREKILEACKSSDIIDGFLNRWLVIDVENRELESFHTKEKSVPKEIIDAVASLNHANDVYGNAIQCQYSPEAADIMRAFREKTEAKIQNTPYPLNTLYGRNTEHVAKIAMIVAEGDLIVCNDVYFAIAMVERSNESVVKLSGNISDNVYESDYIRVREIIAKDGTINRRSLTRKTQFINGGDRRRKEIILSLIESNIICEQINGKEVLYKFIKS